MRWHSALALALAFAAVLTLGTDFADARAGGGGSGGSRGSRSFNAPAATPTAPSIRQSNPASPSAMPSTPGAASQAAAPQRSRFGGGMLGGLLGAGLLGALLGYGFSGGLGGIASFIGLLLQMALVAGLVMLAIRFFRNRNQPAMAMAGQAPRSGAPIDLSARMAGGAGSAPRAARPAERQDDLGIGPQDYQAFEGLLKNVQTAYGREDLPSLQRMATPEMAAFFASQLEDNRRNGRINRVDDIRLEQGDLAEAWREPDAEYATVAMRFSMREETLDRETGRPVQGQPNGRETATEIWSFKRPPGGGDWRLSAIQQVN